MSCAGSLWRFIGDVATLVREAPHVDLCENARDRARARERALSLMVDDGLRSEAHERERDGTSAALSL